MWRIHDGTRALQGAYCHPQAHIQSVQTPQEKKTTKMSWCELQYWPDWWRVYNPSNKATKVS